MRVESNRFRLGWIPFWNMHPLRYELEAILGHRLDWIEGTPNVVNKALKEGGVHLAASSSVCLIQSENVQTALPLGIGAKGPVQSVYWGLVHPDQEKWVEQIQARTRELKKDFQEISRNNSVLDREFVTEFFRKACQSATPFPDAPSLWLTPASAASAALSRVLYCLFFGKPWNSPGAVEKSDMQLLIGDEALLMAPVFAFRLDLAAIWKEITGLPFVFAIWQQSDAVDPVLLEKVQSAAILAQEKIESDPGFYLPKDLPTDVAGNWVDLAGYWKKIHYCLDQKDLQSLRLYLSLVQELEQSTGKRSSMQKSFSQGLFDLHGTLLSSSVSGSVSGSLS